MVKIFLIAAGVALLLFAFGVFGNLPPTPEWLENSSNAVLAFTHQIVYIFSVILGGHLLFGMLSIGFAIMIWKPTFQLVEWIWGKISPLIS